MLIPISCDAPIYHWPVATVGLIVANVLAYFIGWGHIASDEMAFLVWVLVHGDGLHPLQWVTSIFMHQNIMHLVGNMIFLWVFGLVVEGKVGWWKFLVMYLGIGILQSALEQVTMLGADEINFSLGASSAIYGIMLIAVVWAPKNDINCFYWFGFAIMGTADIPIFIFALIYLAFDAVYMLLAFASSGNVMSSGWLHIMGGVLGAVVGTVLVKRNLVDCEGWDLFHVWNGSDPAKEPDYTQIDHRVAEKKQALEEDQLHHAASQFDTYLEAGHAAAAAVLWKKMQLVGGGLQIPQKQLTTAIRGLLAQKEWQLAAPLLNDLVHRFPTGTEVARLKLAELCVLHLERPARALELLKSIDYRQQPPERLQLAKKLAHRAKQMQSEGVYELEDEAF